MTLDRRDLICAAAAALPVLAWGREAAAAPPVDLGLDALLAATGAPALAGAVVTPTGVQTLVAAGVRRLGGPDRVTPNDLWHIGSNTKAMTAALYGKLVEGGKASWGATIPALFPRLKTDPAWQAITIEALLSHHAGVSDSHIAVGDWFMRAHADKRPVAVQRAELAGQVFGAPPAGKPGVFDYSNMGVVLAGAAIEQITRASWEDTITRSLFKPLGMASAGFGAPTGDQPWGHAGNTPGKLNPVDPKGLADNPPILGPAGRVRLSLADYAKFAHLFITDGGGYLRPATIARLTTPQPGEGRPYALGWGIANPAWAQGPLIAHEGSNTLWHAVILVAPRRKIAILTACNAGPDGSKRAAFTLAQRLQAAYAPG